MTYRDKDARIVNRNNWFFLGIIALFAVIVAYKLVFSPITLNLTNFSFTDLLNLILAIFAIAMSVAFYLKATDTSNQFYDNTYKFTKEVSEILGRIEAGFGERLKHLDEGYAGIKERVERMPIDPVKAEQAVKKEEEEVKKREQERKKLLDDLANRAKLEEHEKEKLFHQLQQKEVDLVRARRELEFLKDRLMQSEGRSAQRTLNIRELSYPRKIVDYIESRVIPELGGRLEIRRLSPGALKKRFDSLKGQFPLSFIEDLKRLELVNKDGLLNSNGVKAIKDVMSYRTE